MDDLISMLAGGNVDPQVIAAALRKQQVLGLLGQLSGDRVLAPVGQTVGRQVGQQQETLSNELQQGPQRSLRMALEKQALAKGEQQAADMAHPATGKILRQSLASMGVDAGDAPASVMQTILPVAEKAFSAKEGAASRREAAAARTQPQRDKAQATNDDAEGIAQAIMDGTQPPDMKGLYRYSAPVRAHLAKRGYDLTTAQRDWQAISKHLATLNGPQQERLRQAITFTTDSLDNIEGLYGDWLKFGPASGFKVLNKGALALAKNLPGEAGATAAALEAQINDLVSELGTVYKGGNASTDETLRLAAENLKGDWNEETFKKAIEQIRKNLTIRKNSMLTSTPAGVSAGSKFAAQPAPGLPEGEAKGGGTVRVQHEGKVFEIPRSSLAEALKDGAVEVK